MVAASPWRRWVYVDHPRGDWLIWDRGVDQHLIHPEGAKVHILRICKKDDKG